MEHVASAIISKSSFIPLQHISKAGSYYCASRIKRRCERWPYGLLSVNCTPSWHRHVTNVDVHIHEITLPTVQRVDKLYWWLLTTISPRNLDSDDFTEILIPNSVDSDNNSKSNNHCTYEQNSMAMRKIGKSENEKSGMKIAWSLYEIYFNKRPMHVILVLVSHNSGKPKWLNIDGAMSY